MFNITILILVFALADMVGEKKICHTNEKVDKSMLEHFLTAMHEGLPPPQECIQII
jgi:hypothetical protein